mmetsp:Transcript_33491/g.41340  ORF Transcript_33491/g.41340 Transcript_33491/m.41340 type:complete len:82 (+) Transcript_33491:232-477(+)
MGVSQTILISFGTATAVFLPLVLICTRVFDGGFLAICICTMVHLMLRFIVALIYINCKSDLRAANDAAHFWQRDTFRNFGG